MTGEPASQHTIKLYCYFEINPKDPLYISSRHPIVFREADNKYAVKLKYPA